MTGPIAFNSIAMNLSRFITPALVLAATGALALNSALATPAAAGVSQGDTPEYSWKDAPIGSMGKTSLADMKGTPVLVEFWGTR